MPQVINHCYLLCAFLLTPVSGLTKFRSRPLLRWMQCYRWSRFQFQWARTTRYPTRTVERVAWGTLRITESVKAKSVNNMLWDLRQSVAYVIGTAHTAGVMSSWILSGTMLDAEHRVGSRLIFHSVCFEVFVSNTAKMIQKGLLLLHIELPSNFTSSRTNVQVNRNNIYPCRIIHPFKVGCLQKLSRYCYHHESFLCHSSFTEQHSRKIFRNILSRSQIEFKIF